MSSPHKISNSSLSGAMCFLSILPNTIATFSYQSKHMKQKENTVAFHFVVTDALYIFRACVVMYGKGKTHSGTNRIYIITSVNRGEPGLVNLD